MTKDIKRQQKPIKILHIVTDTNIGGLARLLMYLLDAYDKSAFTMEVIVPEGARLIPLLKNHGITYYEAPNIADKSFSLGGIITLRRMINQIKPDIVHTHSSFSGRKAGKLCRVKVIHTRHSTFPVAAWKKRFPARQFLGLINNSLSDKIIAVSPAAKENLTDIGTNPKKIQVIFNGVPPAKNFTKQEIEDLKQKYNIPSDTFVCTIMARLTEVKGHDDILDAAKSLPGVLILIAGDGDRKAHLQARITAEGITNVRLLGFIDETDELIAISNVQLNASFGTEASSMALLQGMSAGLPAIVSDYGGNPYVIIDGVNGLVFPTRDSKAMTSAIKKLMGDKQLDKRFDLKWTEDEPKRAAVGAFLATDDAQFQTKSLYQQLSKGAIQTYNDHFTIEKMIQETQNAYKEIIQ